MTTSSVGPGICPLLQLAEVFQSPLPPTQNTVAALASLGSISSARNQLSQKRRRTELLGKDATGVIEQGESRNLSGGGHAKRCLESDNLADV